MGCLTIKTGKVLLLCCMIVSLGISGCQKTKTAEYREVLSLRLEHTPVKKHTGTGDAKIRATIISSFDLDSDGMQVIFRKKGEDFRSVPMVPTVLENEFVSAIPAMKKGTRVEYYIQVRSVTGATITLPKNAMKTGKSYMMTFSGVVPGLISAIHFICVCIGLFLILVAGYWAFLYLKTGDKLSGIKKAAPAGTFFLFLGGIPLHILVKILSTGAFWEGIPVGSDKTDTLTLLLLLYWIGALFLYKGSLFQGGEEKDYVSDRMFSILVLIGTLLTVLIFLLPG